MNTVKNTSVDLIFSLVDEQQQAKSFSVTTATCKLAKQQGGEKIVCLVNRDQDGACVEVVSGQVKLNGQLVTAGRLSEGDQLELGDSTYEVTQLGFWFANQANPLSSAEQDAYQKRIQELEAQLNKQNQTVENMHSEFDRMSGQLSTLMQMIKNDANKSDTTGDATSTASNTSLDIEKIIADATGSLDEPADTHSGNEYSDSPNPAASNDHEQIDDQPTGNANALPTHSGLETEPVIHDEFVNEAEANGSRPDEPQSNLTEAETGPASTAAIDLENYFSEAIPQQEPVREQEAAGDEVAMGRDEDPVDATESSQLDLLNRLQALTNPALDDAVEVTVAEEDNLVAFESENLKADECDQNLSLDSLPQDSTLEIHPGEQSQEEPESEPASEPKDQLGALLASLEKSSGAKEEPDTQQADLAVMEESSTESTDEAVATNVNVDSVEDQAIEDTDASSDLERLFSTLREKDRLTANEDPTNETDVPQQNAPVDSLSKFNGPLVDEAPNESGLNQETPVQPAFENESQTTVGDENSLELNSLELNSPSETTGESGESSADVETQSSERNLLDQLRSLQREQAAIVEEEDQAVTEGMTNEVNDLPTFDEPGSPLSGLADSILADTQESIAPPMNEDQTTLPTEPPSTESAEGNEPPEQESVADVLARMNYTPELENEQTEPALPAPVQTPAIDPVAEPVSVEPTSTSPDEGGEDVQDYMNSLLQRLKGDTPGEELSTVAVPTQETPPPVSVSESEAEPVEDVVPLNPEEFVPKRVAPELNTDLAAMRELANASTRSAVKTSEMKKKQDFGNTLLLAAGAAISGAVATTFLSTTPGDTFYWLSVALYATTCVCSGLYGKSLVFNESKMGGDSNFQNSTASFKLFFNELAKKLSRSPEVED